MTPIQLWLPMFFGGIARPNLQKYGSTRAHSASLIDDG